MSDLIERLRRDDKLSREEDPHLYNGILGEAADALERASTEVRVLKAHFWALRSYWGDVEMDKGQFAEIYPRTLNAMIKEDPTCFDLPNADSGKQE